MRRIASETFSVYEKKHNIHALTEIDVTTPRMLINQYKQKIGEKISFTAFIVNCVAKAIEENEIVHAIRYGKKKIVIFDDVDIVTLVERFVNGESWPTYRTIRAANKKSLKEVHDEIRAAQVEQVNINETKQLMKRFLKMPRFIRMPLRKRVQSNPFSIKKHTGTAIVTAVGMFGTGVGWGIPYVGYSLSVTIGGITRKPLVIENKIEIRECLNLTLSFDHDIIDGAPAARFLARLKELIETGYELESFNGK
jgi:pyruvate/2-oxoglutarate dehydrogenase complex dihydrolipoamide acyltransferase (E2) component